ncbi:transposase, partial [Actinomyces urogenitalis]|uniref:transposase n=1 Tax=Actinomyces urogenitalis TaxID=103621 RepID=UPI0039820DED
RGLPGARQEESESDDAGGDRCDQQRAGDILAFFDRPGTSNGPTEAINGRLEHLRGSALGFRNLTHYIARSLLEAGGFRPALHPRS